MRQPRAFKINVTQTYTVVLETTSLDHAKHIIDDLTDAGELAAAARGAATSWDSWLGKVEVDTNSFQSRVIGDAGGILREPICGENDTVPGVIIGMDFDEGIQRCDECDWYDGDLAAAAVVAARFPGAVVRWNGDDGQVHTGTDVPDGVLPAPERAGNPWLELNGEPINLLTTPIPPLP